MTDKPTPIETGMRAGSFLLALNDADRDEACRILAEVGESREATLAFVLEIGHMAIGLAEKYAGPRWPEAMGWTLRELDLERDTPSADPGIGGAR